MVRHSLLSAVAAADSKADLIAQFAEDYVTKPYDYGELAARIRRHLGAKAWVERACPCHAGE